MLPSAGPNYNMLHCPPMSGSFDTRTCAINIGSYVPRHEVLHQCFGNLLHQFWQPTLPRGALANEHQGSSSSLKLHRHGMNACNSEPKHCLGQGCRSRPVLQNW
jgi:hypothetical protein